MQRLLLAVLLCALPTSVFAQEQRASTAERTLAGKPIGVWVQQLEDTSSTRAQEALNAFYQAGPIAASAVPSLILMTGSGAEHVRSNAALAIGMIGPPAAEAVPALTRLVRDPSERVRINAIEALGVIGPPAHAAVPDLAARMADQSSEVRGWVIWALGQIGGAEAVHHLTQALTSSDEEIQLLAIRFLARQGPEARSAVPFLVPFLADTAGGIAGEVAAAVGRILPRTLPHVIPMMVQIEADAGALRDDGWGAYVTGVDSVGAPACEALNLLMKWRSQRPCYDPLYQQPSHTRMRGVPEPRSLRFDLSRPVAGSGSLSRDLIQDSTAEIHIFWRHEHEKRIDGIYLMPVSDSVLASERVQFHFKIDGKPHRLQMGAWVAGEFQRNVPKIHGEGTTEARISRPSEREWTVEAPAGSRARLWNVENPRSPIDLGLYEFPFRIRWQALEKP